MKQAEFATLWNDPTLVLPPHAPPGRGAAQKAGEGKSGRAVLSAIDRQFAGLIQRLGGDAPEVTVAAALLSQQRSQGNICVDLDALDAENVSAVAAELGCAAPKRESFRKLLRASPVVGRPSEFKPLILDPAGRLYLHRYWKYESDLANALQRLAGEEIACDLAKLKAGLQRLFPKVVPAELDWQMVAAFAATRRRLTVISGGPGTGKTRTVVLLLALLLEQEVREHSSRNGALRIALAAPTGKAAARLQESLKQAKASLDCTEEIKTLLPEEAGTIHRLLGAIPDSSCFRHDAAHPLTADVVVVDEASMVDLALMARLVAALPPRARLILVGDKDQLASVEAGAVLADVCDSGGNRTYSSHFAAEYAGATGQLLPGVSDRGQAPLRDCIVELRRNYRFGETSGIYKLSQAVNAGDASAAAAILRKPASTGAEILAQVLPQPQALKEALRKAVLKPFRALAKAAEPAPALHELGRFRILCALRNGPYGVEGINRMVEEILDEAGLLQTTGPFYPGRPVLVRRNDYNLKLYNGDVGILLPEPAGSELRAWFPAADGTLRSFLPLRLPEHETAYAMTVHKSQGSEFERVLLVLPPEDSPVLTRELLYTGLTRASKQVQIWFAPAILQTMIQRKTARHSGLRDLLWGPLSPQR